MPFHLLPFSIMIAYWLGFASGKIHSNGDQDFSVAMSIVVTVFSTFAVIALSL